LASVVPAVPTPLPPPWINSVSPRFARASSKTFKYAVRKTSGIAPASSHESAPGTRIADPASTTASSA